MKKELGWDDIVQSMDMGEPIRALEATVKTLGPEGQWFLNYAIVDFDTGLWQFQDALGLWSRSPDFGWTVSNGDHAKMLPHDRDEWKPDSLQLFFPAEMPIWGRATDEWLISDATVHGDEVHLSLRYFSDSDIGASATLSLRWKVVTEFITPWSETVLHGLTPSPASQATIQEPLFEL